LILSSKTSVAAAAEGPDKASAVNSDNRAGVSFMDSGFQTKVRESYRPFMKV
jgi:hypothetical protein